MTDKEGPMKSIHLPNEETTQKLAFDLATLSESGEIGRAHV